MFHCSLLSVVVVGGGGRGGVVVVLLVFQFLVIARFGNQRAW